MSDQITNNKKYIITKLWITKPGQVDTSTWTFNDDHSYPKGHHGPRMIPNSKTGQMNIMMGIDSRVNHGCTRTGDAMIRFIYTLAAKVGMQDPMKIARKYAWCWLNEGLIKEVI